MIIGCCGAGKSTLAFKLGEHFNLPLFHLDQLFWKSGWAQADMDEWIEKHQGIIEKPEWIIDGNYKSTMQERLEHAELVICMDMPRWRCVWGILKRRIQYSGKVRPDMTEGCKERLDWDFLKYVWHFHRDQLPDLLKKLEAFKGEKTIHRVRSRRQASDLLEDLFSEQAS